MYLFHTHLELVLRAAALIRERRLLEGDIYIYLSVKWCGAHLRLGAYEGKFGTYHITSILILRVSLGNP